MSMFFLSMIALVLVLSLLSSIVSYAIKDVHEKHRHFLLEAYHIACYSQDPRTQVGVVIVLNNDIIGTGFNYLPRGFNRSIWEDREKKNNYVVHAEVAAIEDARRHNNGVFLNGATMYMSWIPCRKCAQAIVDAGL